ncbi:hypothetical protein VTK73DRAFT_4935 [Phialemonium thermophilum]|uniref:F-box domain-containing protein n=1 Tax=Phialemonium thermophilum TaxID=223376 RepID=A0ABR3WR32_9PEZI
MPQIFSKIKFFKKKDKTGPDYSLSRGYDGAGSSGASAYGSNSNSQSLRHNGYYGSASRDPFGGRSDPAGRSNPYRAMATPRSAAVLMNLPPPVLQRLFTFLCPHVLDETYETCEQSSVEESCMLCGLRDLAHCVAVCRRWRPEATKLLYHSIRIDSVHYCDLETVLSEKRKRRSFFDRNGDPEDTAHARLQLLCRTLREDPARLGPLVQFFKTPYMLRESSQADLARTIAVLPNLKYVDLPEGVFTDDPAFLTLRLEIQARCRDLRKMTYMAGAERSLQQLANGNVWPQLEVLELIRVNVDPTTLRRVLGALRNLHALKVSETKAFTDEALWWNDMLPPFPPLDEFILNDVPYVTAEGLKQWLMIDDARLAIKVLTLNRTGVKPWTLYEFVGATPALKHLSIIDTVSTTMPAAANMQNVPPLVSESLETLHYEITAEGFPGPSTTASYYNYLASSLLAGGLPNLRALYVRDPNFADTLLGLAPPMPSFAEGGVARPASSGSNSPFSARFSNQSLSSGFSPTSPQGFLSPGRSSFARPEPMGPPGPRFQNPFGGQSEGSGQQGPYLSAQAARSTSSLGLPDPRFAGQQAGPNRFSSNNPFASIAANPPPQRGGSLGTTGASAGGITNLPHMLEVFTKGDDELDWSFTKVTPGGLGGGGAGATGPTRRPSSSYGLGADVMGGSGGWTTGSGARRSVFVGGAGGGFLAVPTQDAGGGRRGRNFSSDSGGGDDLWPRPKSSAGEKKRDKLDLWR